MGTILSRTTELGKAGYALYPSGPLGRLNQDEWIKWLNYMPNFLQERINFLSNKKSSELTSDEIEELKSYKKELEMAEISRKYGYEDIDYNMALKYHDYLYETDIERIIQKKLTKEEYIDAIEIATKMKNNLSYSEILNYCKEKEKKYNELSMKESFILRLMEQRLHYKTDNTKIVEELSPVIENTREMFAKSLRNAEKKS
ncbi:MAG: hypothetical protein VZS44_06730 [Bacilli bacterium]|nr:hypothetical protein [Bacilli bacterium]